MKYIKKFNIPNQADGYQISNIPFICFIESTNQIMHCNEYAKMLKQYENTIVIELCQSAITLLTLDNSDILELTISGTLNKSDITHRIDLVSVNIGNIITNIGEQAFSGCSNIKFITIPDSVTTIGSLAFEYCTELTSLTLPNSITYIGNAAFYSCSKLTSFIIPNGISSINAGVFEKCSNLTSITIPNSILNIGYYAFHECSSLNTITFNGYMSEWNNIEKDDYWNYESSITTIHCYDGDIDITPPVILPNIILYLSSGEEIEINDTTVTKNKISPYMYSLQRCVINDGVTSIENNAFEYCFDLTNISIGGDVETIGSNVFTYCEISSLTCLSTEPPTITNTTFSNATISHIYVPTNSINNYKSAQYWSAYASIIESI